MLTGKNNEEKIWNYLIEKGLSKAGAAGLMGNLNAESALNPKNLQNSYEKKLGYTDDSYTAAVDNGSYNNFVRDSAGYGLAQWTYWSRKQNMLEFARAAGKSIGDLEMQLDFLFKELSEGYKTVLATLKAATTVKAASDSVLLNYERPADQSEAVKKKRASYGQTYYDRYAGAASKPGNGGNTMTGNELRQQVCNIINGWIGATKGSTKHLEILSTYNDHKPLARGYKVQVNDAYCATATSAAYIKAGIADYTGTECGVENYVKVAQAKGIWEENDAHIPKLAEAVVYDWDDNGVGDNKGYSDHIGIITQVNGASSFTVTEGNMSGGKVGTRTMQVNGKYIRGFICPDFDSIAKKIGGGQASAPAAPATGSLKVGDVVNFTGSRHYTSANAASGPACKPGPAKITQIYQLGKSKHPYHLVAVSGGGSTVYGWVDASDIDGGAAAAGSKTYTVKSGDSLWAIAQKQLGNGNRYPEIKSLNNLSSDTIHPGQVLKLPN